MKRNVVKTAVAGEDPNWGRIVAAVGRSGEWADRDRLMIKIGDEVAAKDGELNPLYSEEKAAAHMKQPYISFIIDVGVGHGEATIWTCDFTAQYVAINADYRS
jgi:glutamate N-acetyltransferase/amino-acid N-acetyltransferase